MSRVKHIVTKTEYSRVYFTYYHIWYKNKYIYIERERAKEIYNNIYYYTCTRNIIVKNQWTNGNHCVIHVTIIYS